MVGQQPDESNVQYVKWFVLFVKHRPAIETKPSVQHSRIDATKISVELQCVVVQIGEAGMRPDETAF
jgi:hypothetical protein